MISKCDIKGNYEKELKYEKIAVIGIGSIGGYFANYLSIMLEKILHTIVLVDPEIVEEKNLRNSIFEYKDIGKQKTTAVREKINSNNPHILVVEIREKFVEKKIDPVINDCDLVFDCRDWIYNRHGKIDARIYISEYYIIIDCNRIAIKNYNYHGSYHRPVTKHQIIQASLFATKVITNEFKFSQLLKDQTIQIQDITTLKNFDTENDSIDLDVIFDLSRKNFNIINLVQYYPTILKLNENSDIKVSLYHELFYTTSTVIPKNSILYISDLDKLLQRVAIDDYKNHIIANINMEKSFIILIPEDGGA